MQYKLGIWFQTVMKHDHPVLKEKKGQFLLLKGHNVIVYESPLFIGFVTSQFWHEIFSGMVCERYNISLRHKSGKH